MIDLDRYGPRADGEEVMSMYGNSRGQGFGPEVGHGLEQELTRSCQVVIRSLSANLWNPPVRLCI